MMKKNKGDLKISFQITLLFFNCIADLESHPKPSLAQPPHTFSSNHIQNHSQ